MKRIVDTWSKDLPKDPVKNVQLRLKLLKACRTDLVLRQGVMEVCALDPVFWINLFVIQANPVHPVHKVGPFITREYQDKTIKEIIRDIFIELQDHLIEKSREEGASWAAICAFIWVCLFHYNQQVFAVSNTEKSVDNGPADSKSLFWKARFLIRRLPDWMTRGVQMRKLGIEFPATESSFTGEASTGRSAVGGRGPCLLDEFAQMTNSEAIWSNTADVGPRLVISTHYRTKDGAEFARLCDRRNIRKSMWHWSMNKDKARGLYRVRHKDAEPELLDPDFDYTNYPFNLSGKPGGPFPGLRSVWYDKECERRGNAKSTALHLDIDREGASSQFFDAQILQELILQYGTYPKWEGVVNFDKITGKFIGLTKRTGGNFRLWRTPDLYGKLVPGKFALGVDVSEGQSVTPSCVSVFDAVLCEKVAELSDSRVGGWELAPLVCAIGWLFANEQGDPATVCWETNGPGGKFGSRLIELKYPKIHKRILIPPDVPTPVYTDKPGWNSSPREKLILLEDYREAIETRRCINRSLPSLEECKQFYFNKTTGKIEHSQQVGASDGSEAGENHADMAIADALAWMVCLRLGSGVREVERAKEIPIGSMLWRREYARNKEREMESSWDNR